LKQWKTSLSKLKDKIAKCNIVIAFLDNLEEERPLFLTENNFRKVVKAHYEKLLHAQLLYWKKRCTTRWIKLGEENTQYFHSMATIRYKRNAIVSLMTEDGRIVSDHEEMAALALNCYKNRMGTQKGISMCLNLQNLLHRVDGLDNLTVPFTHEEMDNVISKMKPDKAPGPDGFNGLFLKKCWPIVKASFYKLAEDFYDNKINLESINTSYITLIPKCHSPEKINDYRPISLTNCCLKFLTKIVAD
jgi:hypothetical protein